MATSQPSFFSARLRWNAVFTGLAIAACLPTWTAFCARFWWLFDVTTSFVWWYGICLPLLLVGAVLARRRWLSLLVFVSLVVNVVQLAPYAPVATGPSNAADGPRLRAMTLNVLTASKSSDKVLRLIEAEDPDVVLLLEVNQRWIDELAPLDDRYPHRGQRIRPDNFGVVLFSRLPADEIRVREITPNGTPTAVAKLTWNGQPLTVVGAHPLAPTSSLKAATRNADLAAYADLAADQNGSVVVMGDLNVAPFSPHFQDLLSNGRLYDSAASRGVYSTWGTPRLGLVVPIDHVLHTGDLRVVDRRIGPGVGSDHRAVTVDFEPAADLSR